MEMVYTISMHYMVYTMFPCLHGIYHVPWPTWYIPFPSMDMVYNVSIGNAYIIYHLFPCLHGIYHFHAYIITISIYNVSMEMDMVYNKHGNGI